MTRKEPVNILLVDDQPAKLLSYETILGDLGENLLKASSAREGLELLLRNEIAIILVDVCMPELDGFQLAQMVRNHPRYEKTAIIFISAIQIEDVDRLRGYEMGAVDYVPVPVVPAVLQAKVRVFAELYRKTRQLERLNSELESRVAERTAELQAAMERQYLLTREVDHRAKNALAVVQSIMRLTRAPSIEAYTKAVEGRVQALARVHTILAEARWRSADLNVLVARELAPYAVSESATRIALSGAPVQLPPVVAQTLALVVHELATNSAKYGGLSTSAGSVAVDWSLKEGELAFRWIERGGPATSRPLAEGFGMRVSKTAIEKQLGGTLAFEWLETGLRCTLTIPYVSRIGAASTPGEAPAANGSLAKGNGSTGAGKKGCVLLVEDEALIGLSIRDELVQGGYEVLGPATSIEEALRLVSDGMFDQAVLDLNLNGIMAYPIAERLKLLGRPFIFLTGYDQSTVEERFAETPILSKPVNIDALLDLLNRRTSHAMPVAAHFLRSQA